MSHFVFKLHTDCAFVYTHVSSLSVAWLLITLFLAYSQLVGKCFCPLFRQPLNGIKGLKDGGEQENSQSQEH